jgi:uncharacterized membrane-anchored protein
MNDKALSKVPAVTLGFWVIKIIATTLGETGGDTLSMTMNWGYLASSALFVSILLALIALQIAAKKFQPMLYWATIIASTTAGTTLADATRSLGIGYPGGTILLLALVLAALAIWYWSEKSIAVDTVSTPKVEAFYWVTITFSQTLGTALGDWIADSPAPWGAEQIGYLGAAALFAAVLGLVAALYFWTKLSRVLLFWAAFILTRPFGAALGDFLDKPLDKGGLDFSRPLASAVLGAIILALIFLLPQRAGEHPKPA